MKNLAFYFACFVVFCFTSCGSSNKIIIPSNKTLPSLDHNYPIVWVGKGESYVYQNGTYLRSEANDYAFEVTQRRYGNSWKSVKNMHRIHPDYDGKAGAREQTMFFGIDFSKSGANITSVITSSAIIQRRIS